MNRVCTGARCRTIRNIVTAKGLLRRGMFGVLRRETTTALGRRRILVDWDNGISVPVSPHEIAVETQGEMLS